MEKSSKRKENPGLKLAAAYGAAPNRLGFCGPQGKANCQKISRYLTDKLKGSEIRHILEKFEAAHSYLELIARKNKIKDPFDLRVVKAFWVGNAMLEKVTTRDIKKMVLEKFAKPGLLSEKEAKKRIKIIPRNIFPHHSFHVYILGAVTGRISLKDVRLKDICRIGWGMVKKIKNSKGKNKIVVFYNPIVIGVGGKLVFGRKISKEINWNKKIFPDVKIGDEISFHWNVLCQKLSSSDISNLEKYTKHTLAAVNL